MAATPAVPQMFSHFWATSIAEEYLDQSTDIRRVPVVLEKAPGLMVPFGFRNIGWMALKNSSAGAKEFLWSAGTENSKQEAIYQCLYRLIVRYVPGFLSKSLIE